MCKCNFSFSNGKKLFVCTALNKCILLLKWNYKALDINMLLSVLTLLNGFIYNKIKMFKSVTSCPCVTKSLSHFLFF